MAEIRIAGDYHERVIQASLSVLVELYTILGRYSDALVLVGGWAPYFLLERHQRNENDFEHVGSIDIDLAVDPRIVDEPAYATIVELIGKRGYKPRKDKLGNVIPFSFERELESEEGSTVKIQVDFLTALDAKAGKRRRHKAVQPDLKARMARGCDVVFNHNFKHKVTATLPDDGEKTIELKVADLVGILTTKGIALGERYKEKDAYDIYAAIANYEGGPQDAAAVVKPFAGDPLVAEALDNIRKAFESQKAHGPDWVATFIGAPSLAERERIRTDAYMNVSEFLRLAIPEKP